MDPVDLSLTMIFYRFSIALVLGMLVGLEREHTQETTQPEEEKFAGLRTFAFISLLGCASAFVTNLGLDWFFAAAFVALTALVGVAYTVTSAAGEPGMTTEVTALLVFVFGGLTYWGHLELAASLAVVVTLFLSLKRPLHTWVARLSGAGNIATDVATRAVVLAAASNTLVKGGMAVFLGSSALRYYALPIFGSLVVSAVLSAVVLVG